MWWGGGDDEDVKDPADGEDSPPLEILAEDEEIESANLSPRSTGASLPMKVTRPRPLSRTSTMTSSTERAELKDLREQFQMQEDLLGHLKGVLKSNEEKLHMKDLEVEGYAMRLGKVRSRRSPGPHSTGDSRSSLGSFTGLAMDTQSESALEMFNRDPTSPGLMSDSYTAGTNVHMISTPTQPLHAQSQMGTLGQLRQQFDEIKAKEDEEQKSRKMLEGLVKQLQEELSDRDNVIKEMREEAMSVASFAYTASPFVMSPEGGRSPTTISPSRSPPLGCSVDSATSFDFTAAAYSFDEKDNKILDLKEQVILLERRILDLEENLREKDELIKARTQAVTLMSADLSAKGKSTLDQLDDTRNEMRNMQQRFAEQEVAWKEKYSTLEVDLEARSKRLQVAEQSCDRIEKARFELSTRNAALQEKIVSLQSELAESKLNHREEIASKEEEEKEMLKKMIQLEKSLEKEEKLRNDRKEKFIENLKTVVDDSEMQEKILELENKITEMEEEKGNLQLRLVDFEDMTASDENLKEELKESQTKLQRKEDELDEHVRALSKLETEKLDLVEAMKDRDEEFGRMSNQLSELMSTNEELCRTKVKLEIRAVELEEQKDRWEDERKELEDSMETLKAEVKVRLDTFKDIEDERDRLKIEIDQLNVKDAEYNLNQKYHDQDMVEKAEKIKEQKIAIEEMEKLLQAKAEEIGNILMDLDSKQTELSKISEELERTRAEKEAMEEENHRLNEMLNESEIHAQLLEANKSIENLTSESLRSKEQIETLENDNNAMKNLNSEMQTKLDENETNMSANSETILDLTRRNEEFEKDIQTLRSDKEELILKLETLNNEMLSYRTEFENEKESLQANLKTSDTELCNMKSDFQSMLSIKNEIQQKFDEQTTSFDDLKDKYSGLESEHARRMKDIENIQIQLNNSESGLKENLSRVNESDTVINQLKDNCETLEEANKALKSKLETISAELSEKVSSISSLEETNSKCDIEISKLKDQIADLGANRDSLEDSHVALNESNGAKINELNKENNELKSKLETIKIELSEKIESITHLEEINKKCDSEILEMRNQIKSFDANKTKSEDSEIVLAESNVNKIQELQNIISEKDVEISSLKKDIKELEDESNNDNIIDYKKDTSELQTSMELKDFQIQELTNSLEEIKEECQNLKSQNERITKETEVEINACMNTITEKDCTINDLEAELKTDRKEKEIELKEMLKQIEMLSNEKEELNSSIQSEKKNAAILQENYNKLLGASEISDDTKELIMEKDKAVKKSNLLTDKCKKLISKCKQQENQIKEQEKSMSQQLEALIAEKDNAKEELASKTSELDIQLENEQKYKELSTQAHQEIECLKEKVSQYDSEKKTVEEEWLSKVMKKDALISELETQVEELSNNASKKEVDDTAAIENANLLSEMQGRIDFLEEAYETLNEEKAKIDENTNKLKDKITKLSSERSELYETQISLKDQLSDLKKENSRVAASLEETTKELGKVRQSNIVAQMLESPLLKEVTQEQSKLEVETEVIHPDDDKKPEFDQNRDLEHEKSSVEQPSQDDGSFGGFDNADDDGFGGWDDEEVDLDAPEQNIENTDQMSSVKIEEVHVPSTTKGEQITKENLSEPKIDTSDVSPTKDEEDGGDGWGGWDDEDLDLGDDSEVKPDDKESDTKEEDRFEMKPQVPSAFLASKDIFTHEEPPASLISNVSGWGDDDGFGWGNEDDLPGNLRLSEERDIIEKREMMEKEVVSQTRTLENEMSPSPFANEHIEGNDVLKAKLIEKESYVESLEASIDQLKERLNQLEEKLASKEEAKDEADKEVIKLNDELKERESKLEMLSKETQEQENVLASTQLSATTCMERLDISAEMIEDYKKRIDELSNEQQSLQLELVSSYEELEELRSLKEVKKELEAAKEKIEHFDNYKEEWQSELSKSDDALELAKTELKNINDQLEASENEKNELKDRVSKLGNRQESLDEKIEVLDGENEDLKRQVDDAREKASELEMTVQQLEAKARELEQDLSVEKENISNRNKTIDELNNRISSDSTSEELQSVKMELAGLKQMNEDLKSSQSNLEAEMNRHRADLDNQVRACQETERELETARSNLNERQSEVDNLREELARARQQSIGGADQMQQPIPQMQQQVLHDLAEVNRPPPDVTNQGLLQHPDVANHELGGGSATYPPDLMPVCQQHTENAFMQPQQQPTQSHQLNNMFDLVHGNQNNYASFDQPQIGFQQNDGADPASWFDNLQPVSNAIGPQEDVIAPVQHVDQNVAHQAAQSQEDTSNLRQEKIDLEARVNDLVQERQTLQEQLQSHQNQNLSLQSKVTEIEKLCNSLRTESDEIQEDRKSLQEHLRAKEEEVQKLICQKQGDSDIQALLESKTQECMSLQNMLSSKEESYVANIENIQTQTNSLQQKLSEQEEKYVAICDKLEAKEEEITVLQSTLSKAMSSSMDNPNSKSSLTANTQESINIPSTDDGKVTMPNKPESQSHQSPLAQPAMFNWDDGFGRQFSTSSDPFNFDQQPINPNTADYFGQVADTTSSMLQSSDVVNQQSIPVDHGMAPGMGENDGTQMREEMLSLQAQIQSLQENLDKSESGIEVFKSKLAELENLLSVSQEENTMLRNEIQVLPSADKFEGLLKEKESLESMLKAVESNSFNLEEEIKKMKMMGSTSDSTPAIENMRLIPERTDGVSDNKEAIQKPEEMTSASSFFSQLDQTSNQMGIADAFTTADIQEQLPNQQGSVAPHSEEAQTLSPEDIQWYKTELERYQQAISDWQTWSASQQTEFENLNQSLVQYTEAYNTSVLEVSKLQEQIANSSNNKSSEDEEGSELSKLKGQVKTKDIEINDLTETLDRLTSEKEELRQEMDDLAKQNEELRCSADDQGVDNMVDVALYDEARISLDEANEKCRQLSMEVGVAKEALDQLNKSKLEDSNMLQQLKEEVSNERNKKKELEKEIDRITEECDKKDQDRQLEASKLKEEVKESTDNIENLVKQLDEARENIREKDKIIADSESATQKQNVVQSDSEVREEGEIPQESLQGELEMCKKYLQDWNVWGEAKTNELNTLQKAYDECQLSYNTLNDELVNLKQNQFKESENVEQTEQKTTDDSLFETRKELESMTSENSELNKKLIETQTKLEENVEKLTTMTNDMKIKEQEIDELKKELETRLHAQEEVDAKEKSPSDSSPLQESTPDVGELKAQFEATKIELQTCQQYLQDWHNWSEQRNEEFNTLNKAYTETDEAYKAQASELSNLKELNNSLEEETKKIKESLEVKELELTNIKIQYSNDDQWKNALEGKQIEIDAMEQMNRELHSTISQLKEDMKKRSQEEDKSQTSSLPATKVLEGEGDATEGWGTEDDLLVQSDVGDNNETVLQLEGEISELRHKLRTTEDAKESLQDELNAAKIKHGKLTLKVKTLTKELQNAKGQKSKSASPDDNLLEMAIQDELKSQVTKAEKETSELRKQLKELKEMEANYTNLKARVSEVENALTNTRQERDELSGKVIELQLQIDALMEQQELLQNVEIEKKQIQDSYESLKLRLESLETEKPSHVASIPTAAAIGTSISNETKASSVQEDYAHFQETNKHLQSEIESLKTCIDDQTALNEELQRQLNSFHQQKLSAADSLNPAQTSTYFDSISQQGLQGIPPMSPLEMFSKQSMQVSPQTTITQASQLQQQLSPMHPSSNLQSIPTTAQMTMMGMMERVRHESASTDRESEIRHIFDHDPTEVSAQNDRLQQELDQTKMENKNLTKQMNTWKEQLLDIGTAGDDEPSDPYLSPAVLRSRQDAAYRSVAALQLRVEELTLEVTKLLEERDTLQLKLSNVMRQFERHKDSVSRASTACSTPVPWVDPKTELVELKHKIQELGKLNYALDIAYQKEREERKQLQANLRLGEVNYNMNPAATPSRQSMTPSPESGGAVMHL